MTQLLNEPCNVLQCINCGLVYKELALTSDELTQLYSTDYVHFQNGAGITSSDVNSAKQKLDRCRRLLGGDREPQDIRLLDIGCGAGSFVDIARQYGYRAEGVDPHLPEGLNKPNLKRNSTAELERRAYDIVVLLNVAEHLVEPRQIFAEIRGLLRPDGVMLLTCPYGNSLARRVHRNRWGHLLLDEHLLFWTPESLYRLLREVGFMGRVSFRIAGSPFPFGRCEQTSQLLASNGAGELQRDFVVNANMSWQRRAWQFARFLQGQERIANIVRNIVHISRSGDYLEYAVAVGN